MQNVTLSTAAGDADIEGKEMPEVDADMLEATLDYIRPALQADGGDIVLTGVEDGVVSLEMVGACGGCPLSLMTVKAGIERILIDRVPGVVGVDAK
jgi:Fe-S cluster biogenesis protein NfuA